MYRVRSVDNLSLAIPVRELDLILVDINLLKISGLQITRQNERNGMLEHILVIAVTVCNELGPIPNVRAAVVGKRRSLSPSSVFLDISATFLTYGNRRAHDLKNCAQLLNFTFFEHYMFASNRIIFPKF